MSDYIHDPEDVAELKAFAARNGITTRAATLDPARGPELVTDLAGIRRMADLSPLGPEIAHRILDALNVPRKTNTSKE
ncbi:hypothetical protein [Streptomyces sp. N35]|uniref:hypothetical protein n=1 Tax=Streptomyces sp. N35 TaxID=2795730 RepID=UPI0018F614C3|nr:hypothetical protein [Streptomyces sp. N35]